MLSEPEVNSSFLGVHQIYRCLPWAWITHKRTTSLPHSTITSYKIPESRQPGWIFFTEFRKRGVTFLLIPLPILGDTSVLGFHTQMIRARRPPNICQWICAWFECHVFCQKPNSVCFISINKYTTHYSDLWTISSIFTNFFDKITQKFYQINLRKCMMDDCLRFVSCHLIERQRRRDVELFGLIKKQLVYIINLNHVSTWGCCSAVKQASVTPTIFNCLRGQRIPRSTIPSHGFENVHFVKILLSSSIPIYRMCQVEWSVALFKCSNDAGRRPSAGCETSCLEV